MKLFVEICPDAVYFYSDFVSDSAIAYRYVSNDGTFDTYLVGSFPIKADRMYWFPNSFIGDILDYVTQELGHTIVGFSYQGMEYTR